MMHEDYIHSDLREALRAAWCEATAYPENRDQYDQKDPSWGNCFVSSLAVWAVQGGKLIPGEVDMPSQDGIWHWRNELDGWGHHTPEVVVDATWQQFEEGAKFHPGYNGRQREIIEGSVFTDETLLPRLTLLLERMEEATGYTVDMSAEEIIAKARDAFRMYDPARKAAPARRLPTQP